MAEGRETDGRFAPGNEIWTTRMRSGPPMKYENEDVLREACLEYFNWVRDNPLKEAKLTSAGGKAEVVSVDKMRAMTLTGLCLFLEIHEQTWRDWRKSRPDLSEVMTRAEAIIRTQKFEGAAADLLNANIIARDLGLADKSELTGRDGGPIETKSMDDKELARQIAFLLTKGIQGDTNG